MSAILSTFVMITLKLYLNLFLTKMSDVMSLTQCQSNIIT